MNTPINPTVLAPPAANYSHAILTQDAHRWLHTSGVVPARPDGSVPTDLATQAATVWANIAAMLAEVDMFPSDVVSVTTYLVNGEDLDDDLRVVMTARDHFMAGHRPASTLVTVPALAQAAWRVEVAVVAARSV